MKRKGNLGGIFAMALILVLTLVLSVGSVSAAEPTIVDSGNCGANVTYELDSNGLLTISGEGMMDGYDLDAARPWENQKKSIKRVVIENGVTYIGYNVFSGCTSLTNVVIPDSATSIGWATFKNCTSLTNVVIPHGVTDIASEAFSGCTSLTNVVIPSSVTYIASEAFVGCTGLTSVTIPGSVTSIKNNTFSGCTGLTSVTIPDSVTSIEYDAFSGCTGLMSVMIPSSVTYIGNDAFSGCTGLTSVTIPNSVTSTGGGVFSGCTGLTSVTIPDSVTSIDSGTFSGCTGLISVKIPNSVTHIWDEAFSDCTSLTSVTIPNSVTSIGENAFSGCTGLTSVTIPNSVTRIEPNTFSGCTGLMSVTIPNSVTSIGEDAFSDCTGLTSVTIPGSVTDIESKAFIGCTSLTEVVIPNSVTCIGHDAFHRCTNLSEISLPDSVIGLGNGVFEDCENLMSVRLPQNLTSIPYRFFFGCSKLKSISLPDSVTQIDEDAFGNCDLQEQVVQEIVSSDNITFIGSRAFEGNKNIYTVHIGKNVEYIQTETFNYMSYPSFHDCTNLTSITVSPENQTYTSINGLLCSKDGRSLLYVPVGISGRLDVPAGIETIGGEAMHYAFSIKIVHIPKSVKKIGSDAFPIECTDVYYDGTEEQWNEISIGKNYDSDFPSWVTLHFTCEQHSFTNYVSNGDATCTTDGTKTAKCDKCGQTDTVIDVGSALGHDIVTDEAVSATCTETGLTEGSHCSRCGAVLKAQAEIPALGHDYKNGTCTRCGDEDPNYKPAAPAAPAVKPDYLLSTGKPYLKWKAVDGAVKYYVYRGGSKSGTYQYIGTATKLNYTDTTAKPGYYYYYKVKAVNASGVKSSYSAAVSALCHCARPELNSAQYLSSSGKPYLSWGAVTGAGKYYVYRAGSQNGSYKYIGSTTKTNYTDTTASAGYTYYYKVKAVSKVRSAANSANSKALAVNSHCARPAVKPDYLASTGKPYLKWSAVTGASKYEVYRAGSQNGTYKYIGSTTKTNYTDTTASAGYAYYYKVKAVSKVKTAANSAYSTAVKATCHCAKPVVKITTSSGKPKLTWNAVAGAGKYEVYRATSKNGTYTKMFTTTNRSYTNTNAKAGTTYYYKVKAISRVRSAANSSYSVVKSIRAR